MKRNITIAAVTAAVLAGGGIAATAAFADDDDSAKDRTTTTRSAERTADDGSAEKPATDGRVTLDRAVAAALKAVPGTVTEAELDDEDDDNGPIVWELDVYGSDKVWHDVTVDASSGKVLSTRDDDDNDDRDRHAPRSASVTLKSAADAALGSVPGAVTSVDLDDDDDDDGRKGVAARWDVEVVGKDGQSHELNVDAKTGKVTADDDKDDDRDDDRDDRDDRKGDDGRGDDDGDDS